MNLTSKRMLQFIMVCAGVSALTAAAEPTLFVADSFEAPDGSDNKPIVEYKWVVDGQTTTTNWFMADGDASKIVALDNSAASVGAKGRPFAIADTDLVLNLETEGQTLSRTVGTPLTFGEATPVYVDTLIKFTPSEDNPTIVDESVKAAVFVDVNSNLCIFHGVDSSGSAAAVATSTTVLINPELWYRLTIKLSNMPDAPLDKVFQVYLNGELIVDAAGMDETYASPGSFFYTSSNESTLSMIAFQGTGKIDELVVADMANGFDVAPASVLLTLAFDSAMVSVTTGGVAVANLDVVPTDTAVVITAQPWFEITNPGALFIGGDTTNKFDAMITGINGMVSSGVTATNTIIAAAFSTTAGLPSGFGSYSIGSITTWAQANGQTPESMTAAMLDDYLFNVVPATDAKLVIQSIEVIGENATIVVTTDKPGTVTALSGINGTLKYYTTDDLSVAFEYVGDISVTSAGTTVTKVIPLVDGKFIKAVLE